MQLPRFPLFSEQTQKKTIVELVNNLYKKVERTQCGDNGHSGKDFVKNGFI